MSGSPSQDLGNLAGTYVEDGRILYVKLLGTVLGSIWLVAVGGWIAVQEAIVSIHVMILETAQQQYVRVINAIFGDGAEVITASWGAAYRAAVETEPILAPLTLIVEITITMGLIHYLRQRSGLVI